MVVFSVTRVKILELSVSKTKVYPKWKKSESKSEDYPIIRGVMTIPEVRIAKIIVFTLVKTYNLIKNLQKTVKKVGTMAVFPLIFTNYGTAMTSRKFV